jgi:C4-dicarboxylate-specific signal transduction histidine kinase
MAETGPRPPAVRTSPLDAAVLEQTMRRLVVRELAAFIGHEVNQPLGAIAAHAAAGQRWLQKGNFNEVAAALREIAADVERAACAVRGFADRSPPDDEQVSIDCNAVVRNVLSLAKDTIDGNSISVSTDLEDALPPVHADVAELHRLILNAVMNAVESMAAGDRLRDLSITTRAIPVDQVLVTIRDSGPGIAPEHSEHLFERFFSTRPGHLGMGLAVSRSIAESCGGGIRLESNADRGATLSIELPASKESQDV